MKVMEGSMTFYKVVPPIDVHFRPAIMFTTFRFSHHG